MEYPKNFLWGTATASYQIEGAADADGRTPSIWDDFSHTPGKVAGNENGDTACDHYHRLAEDISLMKALGINAYRFSVSWSRLFPNGGDIPNEAGFAFYDRLIDGLLDAGIEPVLTLFHWDLPSALYEKGGFEWDGISDAFAAYAAECVRRFSPRVKKYCILNEPQCIVHLGYVNGFHAPGKHYPLEKTGPIMRNLLLCYGKAAAAMRAVAPCALELSCATTGTLFYPSTDAPEDVAMARNLSFPSSGEELAFSHNWFWDPILLGVSDIPFLHLSEEDFRIIRQQPDYLGINIYNGKEANRDGIVTRYTGFPRTALGWPVTPKVMNYGLRFLFERYPLPMYIMENGVACNDRVYLDGQVHDDDRIDFLQSYLAEMENAMEAGTNIVGYFHWSLLDNFEWHTGYDPRFGLYFVDYRDLRRIPKDSARWYREYVAKKRNH